MAAFSSPVRLMPALSPRRAASPIMSPGGRRGRAYGSSEESRLRDLSPETTLCAFTQQPMPFDTTLDEYKIFSCIDTLTVAERDLGTRVAKAAQRLKSWCAEIEQWGWSGSFEQPSMADREQKRRSIEFRIREHVADPDLTDALAPLEYWGSLLSVEVEQHEARLDDIEDEMLKLDVEELKEHVLDMHPAGRSRPTSAGYGSSRQHYKVMDDFSFLITQTLLSALPHHSRLKERLNTWTARVSILREAPRFMAELDSAQKAMRAGWDIIELPEDTSDLAFEQWKESVDKTSRVLQGKISDLGRFLDRMLDTLEGREDCLPESWFDVFEDTEADYGRWTHESRRRVMDLDVRRRAEGYIKADDKPRQPLGHVRSATAFKSDLPNNEVETSWSTKAGVVPGNGSMADRKDVRKIPVYQRANTTDINTSIDDIISAGDDTVSAMIPSHTNLVPSQPRDSATSSSVQLFEQADATVEPSPASVRIIPENISFSESSMPAENPEYEPEALQTDDESEFEEGDTVVHYELDDAPEETVAAQSTSKNLSTNQSASDAQAVDLPQKRPTPLALSNNSAALTSDRQTGTTEPPKTPRSRRGSVGSLSTEMSFDSSPHSTVEESPSVRNATNRALRAPRPELNAAMAKRRLAKTTIIDDTTSPPWPPTRFAESSPTSADDLERKISDILTTIPAHIRLTSGPGPDAPEVKSSRGLAVRGSRANLRGARSASGLKSPEMTLSPAKSEFETNHSTASRKSGAANRVDNEIKLYHLTQPGTDKPIKLFIRRVGENGERVMVRVGGGWSDLGEYLRQYAEHHGRRTASEAKFEVLGTEVKNPDTSPSRPESVNSKRRSVGGFPFGTGSPGTTPVKSSGLATPSDEPPPPMPNFISTTPGIAEEIGAPSSNSSQRSWQGKEVGLAGPKAKKMELSGEKLQWIEGMMQQARTVSGNVITASHTPFPSDERTGSRDGRPDSRAGSRAGGMKSEFGDLGKVGGTKRIFMKGGKSNMGEH